ncbi:hypothetical protein MAHJHV59_50400 [Mycobacterium avium subsp. hominissuis]
MARTSHAAAAARGYSAVITRLHGESWSGSASVAMAGGAGHRDRGTAGPTFAVQAM